jgi:hypothetical protein
MSIAIRVPSLSNILLFLTAKAQDMWTDILTIMVLYARTMGRKKIIYLQLWIVRGVTFSWCWRVRVPCMDVPAEPGSDSTRGGDPD